MDGTGPSGETLDLSKSQILLIDMEWLGVGKVRVGFVIDGIVYYVHEFLHANRDLAGVYMSTANLPVRYEIENIAAAASATDLVQICSSVISEGGFEEGRGVPFSAGLAAGVAVSTRRPLLSIRPRLTFGSVANRGAILPTSVEVLALSKCAYLEIVYGGAISKSGDLTWADVDATYSIVESNTDATAITGGIVLARFYVPAAARTQSVSPGAQRVNLLSRLPLTLSIAGAHPTTPFSDVLSVVATTAEADPSTVYTSVNWQELY